MSEKFTIGLVTPLPPVAAPLSDGTASMLAKAVIQDANRVHAIEGVFAEVQAICNRHRGNECAKEISALLTRKVW